MNTQSSSLWQLCPKCNGTKRMAGNLNSTSVYQQCDICNGTGLISMVNGHPPVFVSASTPVQSSEDEIDSLPNIYHGKFNSRRINEYIRVGSHYKVGESIVKEIFEAGAIWYKNLVEDELRKK